MRQWNTILETNFEPIAQVSIKCCIYQGDALSSLLFCMGLNPLNKLYLAHWLQNGIYLYMDDIKHQDIKLRVSKVLTHGSTPPTAVTSECCSDRRRVPEW
ncbi:hypothetical protein LDENG_00255600%2C partial [Xyrichtys novacula]|uniref:Uncharacterized protein n=1 Tax=Xyrichtys novacula TaxID=13765 RepID=A0AAV1FGI6_XYRNO|nr:hypothetical protein LDENG_00255600%2C partial [Xyrichtys novacula]